MENDLSSDRKGGLSLGFWITIVRALLVITLGVTLIFFPEKSGRMLFNFMGVFWLTAGFVLFRRQAREHGSRVLRAAGVVGVLTGLLVVTRGFTRDYLTEVLLFDLLGWVILLTGILHMTAGFQIGRRAMSGRTEVSLTMGGFEIVLGAMLIYFRTGEEQLVYFIGTVWALLGGAFLFLDAWRQYRQNKTGGLTDR